MVEKNGFLTLYARDLWRLFILFAWHKFQFGFRGLAAKIGFTVVALRSDD